MIRVVMLGRLGNNLFQYALGRVLAERHGVPLVLDASWFDRAGWNQVSCMRRLGLHAKVVRRFSPGARALLKATGKHYWEYRGVPVIRESTVDQSFDPRIFEAPADCVVMGYFQSALFFEGIAGQIRREIDPGPAVAGLWIPEGLATETSVAVHVRRTDYTRIADFDVCSRNYYRTAMNRLRERVPGARFFIFSDDPAWCREQFQGGDEQVMEADADPLADLHRMSLAGHHVIANSSYSWWAAWLGRKPGQQVLCPPRWTNGAVRVPMEQKLCAGWETVEI